MTRIRMSLAGSGDAAGVVDPHHDQLEAALPALLRFARYMTGDLDVAEDATAEAVSRVLPRLRRGDVADVPSYLRQAIVNELSSRGRRRSIERRARERLGRRRELSMSVDSTTAVEDRLQLAPLLIALPPRQRAVIVSRFIEDRSVRDTASVLGVDEGTVKSQTAKALARLRGWIDDA